MRVQYLPAPAARNENGDKKGHPGAVQEKSCFLCRQPIKRRREMSLNAERPCLSRTAIDQAQVRLILF